MRRVESARFEGGCLGVTRFLAGGLLAGGLLAGGALLGVLRAAEEAGGGGAAAEQGTPRFQWRRASAATVELREAGRPVLAYNHGTIHREGVDARYDRSCYVHPLWGLDGEVITDDFPRDHYHHRGVFWAWPHVGVGGRWYDLWIPDGIRHRAEKTETGLEGRLAVIEARNGWYLGDRKVVDERLRIKVHPASARARAIDFRFEWTATEGPVALRGAEGKSYGGFSIRYAPHEGPVITVPLGRTRGDLAVKRLEWADYSARFASAKEPSGTAIFVAASHPDYPPTWLTRHYGALCVGWPGVEGGTLEKDKPVRCAYRLWVHRGEASLEELKAAYAEYIEGAGSGAGADDTPPAGPTGLRIER